MIKEGMHTHQHHQSSQHVHPGSNKKHEHKGSGTSHSSEDESHKGHDHHKMMIRDFKIRFWISLVISVPVLLLSPMIRDFLQFGLEFEGDHYALFAISTFVYFYGGWPFLKGWWDEMRKGNPGMMTLIGVAISIAYFYSSAVVFGLKGVIFYWELVTLIDVMLAGHWIEMKSVMGAGRSLELLVKMMPSEAHLVLGKEVRDVQLEEIKKDDVLQIKPGEKVPADGVIEDGESYLNESMLTGESKPVRKGKGDAVIGGAVNGNGTLWIRVQHTGKESYLNKVIKLVEEAQKTKSKTQHLADRAAKWLTILAILLGSLTLIIWLWLGFDFVYALERMVSVMVISCPHALGLAIPLVVAISTVVSAQNGLLIRNRTAFENSRKITAILFDKTGTLTKGEFGVSRYDTLSNDHDAKDILRFAASLERNSEHPIAQGIVRKAKEEGFKLPDARNFNSITGKGVEAEIDGNKIKVVSPGFLKEKGIDIPDAVQNNKAETLVYVLIADELAGYIALADEIRPESKEAVKNFQQQKIRVIMATGDNEVVAKAVSKSLGLDAYYAEVLPHEKVDIVKQLQKDGDYVAMTGDGVNDAPALAQADVGIAVGSGTDVAAETADIVLVNSNPADILNLILFGRATYTKMIQNLVWATAYNAFAIPLAAGALYSLGIVPGPAVGAVFMSLSTVIVAFNAQLLKGKMKKLE